MAISNPPQNIAYLHRGHQIVLVCQELSGTRLMRYCILEIPITNTIQNRTRHDIAYFILQFAVLQPASGEANGLDRSLRRLHADDVRRQRRATIENYPAA